MEDKTTLVVTAVPDPQQMPSVQAYLQGVLPLLKGAGGTLVKRLKVDDVVHGHPAGMVLVMDFDSGDAVRAMFASDAYSALLPARDRGFREINILLARGM